MVMALDISATGMVAQQYNMDVIANDIANAGTTAYKRHRTEFQDLIYIEKKRSGSLSSETGSVLPEGINIGTGVSLSAVYRINDQGTIEETGGDLDLAIQGQGFFMIEMPDGTVSYTRDGSFARGPTGDVVTHEGYKLLPGFTLPEGTSQVTINNYGEILASIGNQVDPESLGQIELTRFVNESGLRSIGQNLYAETAASGPPVTDKPGAEGFGTLLQHKLENSNVNIVSLIVQLIKAQRTYEHNSKVMQAASEYLKQLNNLQT